MNRRRRTKANPDAETVKAAFAPDRLRRLFESRMASVEQLRVYLHRVPSRSVVDEDSNVVHVTLDAGRVHGLVVLNNAISGEEHDAILRWVTEGFDPTFSQEYRSDSSDGLAGAQKRSKAVDRWDLSKIPYKSEGEQRTTTRFVTQFDEGTKVAETVLDLNASRVHEIMALVNAGEGGRVVYAAPEEGEEAKLTGRPGAVATSQEAQRASRPEHLVDGESPGWREGASMSLQLEW